MDDDLYEVTIVGGGPVGLFAAFYGGMRQMKVKIIESMPQLGGQLAALYPEKFIYDVAGMPKVTGQTLVNQLIEQAMQFNPAIVLNQTVEDVIKQEDGVFLVNTNHETHYSRSIIITAGVGAFQPRRIDLPNASLYEGENLNYFVDNLSRFKEKNVCILGGGDSAVDWSLMMEPIAKSVTIIHRREQFRAHEKSVEQLINSQVNLLTPYQLKEIKGDGTKIDSIILQKTKSEETLSLDLDELVSNYGFISSLGPIKNWGLELFKNAILVNSTMKTNIEGIFAAGDVISYEGKVKLIATGFGDAATAISSAKTYLDPSARQQPQHSTSLFEKVNP